MAEEVQGFNIKLGLDYAEVDKGLKGLKREMALMNSELDKNLSAFDKGERSIERYETTIQGLNQKMEIQQRIVDESRRKLETVRVAYDRQKQALDDSGRSLDDNRRKYEQLNKTYGESAKEIQSVEKEITGLEKEYNALVKAAEKSEREIKKANKTFGEGSTESKRAQEAFAKQSQEIDELAVAIDDARAAQDKLTDSSGEGVKELLKSEKALESAEQDYTDLSKAVEKTSKEIDKSEISYNTAEKQLNGIRGSLDRTTANMEEFRREQALQDSSLIKFGKSLEDGADHLDKFGNFADEAGNKLMILGAGLTAVAGFAGASAFSFEKSQVQIQNSLGLTEAAAEELTDTSKRIFNDGFGPSIEDVDYALIQTRQNIRDLNEEDLEEITKKALILAETFETDVNEVTRAANNMMKGFGIEADEAFDLMASGAQNGLNFSNELFDNVSEYATLFGQMGYSAEEYFALLQAGYEEGAYNLDYINDVMKEFQIRIKDNSKGTTEAMAEMSEGTQAVWQSFMDGEATVKDVMNAVTGDLEGMEDQTKANELGVQLFGTKFEDLEADAVYALGNVDGSLEDVNGTVDQMAENMENSPLQRWLGLWREAKDILMPLGEVLLDIGEDTLPAFESAVGTATEALEDMEPETLKNIAALGGVLIAAGPVIKIIGGIAKVAAPLVGGLGKLAGGFGKVGKSGGDAAGKLGLLGGGLPVVGKALSKVHPVVGAVVGAIGLLGGGFSLAYDKVEWFRDSVDGARDILGILNEFLFEVTGISWLADQFGNAREKLGFLNDTLEIAMDYMGNQLVEPFEKFSELNREAGETVAVFDETVSEATTNALSNYVTLSEEATLALSQLLYGQQEVTEAQVIDVQEKYEAMNTEAQSKLEERRIKELEELNFLFDETDSLTEAEREQMLEKTNAHYNTESDNLNSNNERIQQIITDALQSEEGLQSHRFEQIEMLQNDHNTTTVETLTDGEVEQQAILERMKTNQLATSEETVKQLIADSNESKNKTIADAETKRDEIVAEAIRQRDETGNLSAEQAQKVIDEAEKEYNQSVSKAEDRHRDVVAEAAAQASEHGIIVDGETGDILSKWDQFKISFESSLGVIASMAKRKAGEIGQGIRDGVIGAINWMIDQVNKVPAALDSDWRIPRLSTGSSGTGSAGLGYRPIALSTGTNYHMGGDALLGDVGPGNGAGGASSTREIVELPNQKRYMVDGNVIWPNFPKGAKVKSNRDSEPELKSLGLGGGGPGAGLGMQFWMPSISSPTLTGQNKAIEAGASFGSMVRNIYDYLDDPAALINQLMSEANLPGGGAVASLGTGLLNKLTNPLIDKVKSLFAESAAPMPGVLSPDNISYRYGHTQKYTAETGRYWHSGVDFPHVYSSVRSPIGGTAQIQPFDADGYGNWLTVANGATKLLFAHLSKFGVSSGDKIKAGDSIGTSSNTGFSTGPHLHLEYHENGKVKDPEPWLRGAFRGSFANGGIISQHGIYEGAEGNKPEMILPLTNRSRSIELMMQALELMGGGNNQQQMNIDVSGIIDKLQRQIDLLERNLENQTQMIEVLLRINMKELNIGPNDIGPIVDEYNRRQSSKQSITNGRFSYG